MKLEFPLYDAQANPDIGNEAATNGEDGLLSDQAELGESVDEIQHGVHSLVDLTTWHDVDREGDVVSLEVLLHGLAVQVVDDGVGDEEASAPLLVEVGQVLVLCVEDAVDELEAILDLLEALDAEPVLGAVDRSFHVTHVEEEWLC